VEQGRVVDTEIGISGPFNVTVTGRELTQREKELCKQISAETNPQVLALVTELNHLLQNQPLQELRIPNAV
jgi:hypothetical protein